MKRNGEPRTEKRALFTIAHASFSVLRSLFFWFFERIVAASFLRATSALPFPQPRLQPAHSLTRNGGESPGSALTGTHGEASGRMPWAEGRSNSREQEESRREKSASMGRSRDRPHGFGR